MYLISKIENQEIDIKNAQLYGAYTDDIRFFNGLKIIKESILANKSLNLLGDTTFYISAIIQYKVVNNQVVIYGAGGLDMVNRIVMPIAEMDIDLATFKQYVIDVNGGAAGIDIGGEFGTDALAAAGGVPIGGIYIKPDETGFGGLLAIRRT